MEYEVIDNFLSNDDFDLIKYLLTQPGTLPWYMNNGVASPNDGEIYFTHIFYSNHKVNSDNFHVFKPILNLLNVKALIRIKANMYIGTKDIHQHQNHTDYDFPHKAAVLMINNNDGYTILNDTVKIESKENRLLMFNPLTPHCSTTCTDQPLRLTINFNYF